MEPPKAITIGEDDVVINKYLLHPVRSRETLRALAASNGAHNKSLALARDPLVRVSGEEEKPKWLVGARSAMPQHDAM